MIPRLNTAQTLLFKLGFSRPQLISHEKGKLPSSRKKGPGRKHSQGPKTRN